MSTAKLEYIWLDGYVPTQNMRSKTKILKDFDGKLEVRSSSLEHNMCRLDEKMDNTGNELSNLKKNITKDRAQIVRRILGHSVTRDDMLSPKKLDGKMDTASNTVEGLGTSMDEKFQSLVHKIKLHQSGEYLTVEALEQVKFKSFS